MMASDEFKINENFNRYSNGRRYLPLACPPEESPTKSLAENLAEYRELCYKVAYEYYRSQDYTKEEIIEVLFEAAPARRDSVSVVESNLRKLARALDEPEVPIDLSEFWQLAYSLSTEDIYANFVWISPLNDVLKEVGSCDAADLKNSLEGDYGFGRYGIKVGKMFDLGDDHNGNWLFMAQLSIEEEGEKVIEWKICYCTPGDSTSVFDSVNQLIERQIMGIKCGKKYQNIWKLDFPPMEEMILVEDDESSVPS
ncbi:hypothetical protein TWF694_005535 [Orbilia ellipsospora]|uniref:DUF1642 domain-containing protein n=1 Tax=Orbilia ellipsospora TaxID=2528407 RepID=A0AAV9WTJ3_9PEZI